MGMGTSYTLLLTAFYVDNGRNLPLWRELPMIAFWLLPSAVGIPIMAYVLLRHPVIRRICAVSQCLDQAETRHAAPKPRRELIAALLLMAASPRRPPGPMGSPTSTRARPSPWWWAPRPGRLRHHDARRRPLHRQAYSGQSDRGGAQHAGRGGITALNYIYNTAERDGTVLALVQNNTPLEPLFGTKQARYDATRLNWLGTRASRSPWCCCGTRCR